MCNINGLVTKLFYISFPYREFPGLQDGFNLVGRGVKKNPLAFEQLIYK